MIEKFFDVTHDLKVGQNLGIPKALLTFGKGEVKNNMPNFKAKKIKRVPVRRIRSKIVNGKEFYYCYWYEKEKQVQVYLGTADAILKKVKGK